MRDLKYKVGALSSVIIPLGIQGETGATTIRIDFSEWTADGTDGYPTISVLTPNGTRYPAATNREDEISEDGSHSVVVWPITDVDTTEFGDGLITMSLYSEGGVLMKSANARTALAPSFLKGDEGAPNQYEYWLDELQERAAQIGQNSVNAMYAAREAVLAAADSESAYQAAKALITLLEAADDPGAYLDKAMALSSTMPFNVAANEWELVDDLYTVSRENLAALDETVAVFLPDESAVNMADGIRAGCEEGTVYLTTPVLPTGAITGTVILLGHMSIEPSIVPASTSATRAAASATAAAASATAAANSQSFLENASATATTLSAGSSATAQYSNGVFSFGIPVGEKGDKGDTGNTGATGATGATPNITIGTVTTGAAGTSAAATMTGTAASPVLNLTIPKGADGAVPAAALAPTEASTTASSAYAIGDRFWLGGTLYVATAAIAAGGTITPNTNCKADVLGDDVTDLKSNLSNSENVSFAYTNLLYKGVANIPNPVFVRKNINSDTKQVSTDSTTRCTNEQLIDIPANAEISVTVASGFGCALFGFNALDTYTGVNVYVNGGNTGSISAIKARLLVYKSDNTQTITIEEANDAVTLSLVASKYIDAFPQTENLVTKVLGKNLFDKTAVTSGYISTNTGGISESSSYSVSDFIPISNGQSIVISPRARHFIAFNADKVAIQSSYINTTTNNLVYTASEDGYIRFDGYNNQLDVIQVEYGTVPTAYESFRYMFEDGVHLSDTMESDVIALGVHNPLREKSILAFGDSIMAGDGNNGTGIADILGSRNDMTVYDYSLGGATITYDANASTPRRNIVTQVNDAISDVTNAPDFIIFDGMTNDINGGALQPIGDISTGYSATLDNTTFSGAFEWIIKTLKSTYPASKLMYVRVHHMSSRNIDNQNTYGERAKSICEKWSVPIADIYNKGGLNTFIEEMHQYTYSSESQPTGDRTHPTQEGYELFYIPLIESTLKSIA